MCLIMASKHIRKIKHLSARVAIKNAPCSFCRRDVDDENIYGKLYTIGDITCHYFCVLLSCCLIQKGKDEEGLFGFLYPDIFAEIERSKRHRCSYCNQEGATLGCSVTQCRKQFHLPCGREKNAVSMFQGNYKSFCQLHAPKQKIPNNIMEKIKARKRVNKQKNIVSNDMCEDTNDMVCVICYERVDAFPSVQTFWPPCCARDAWFHRSCLQRMALSAGIHYLKCPLCNDKEGFYQAVLSQGYYVPDRDAAWELEQNAFAEIYERKITCNAKECKCPEGRDYDLDNGPWDIKLCLLCGSVAAHTHCADVSGHFVCDICKPAAPDDPDYLEDICARTLPGPSQTVTRPRSGPRMPSRMSLRRTKPRIELREPSCSNVLEKIESNQVHSENTIKSRQELHLKTPKREIFKVTDNIENRLLSPLKQFTERLCEKLEDIKVLDNLELDSGEVIELMRKKLKKPKPLAVRRKIVDSIVDNILNDIKGTGKRQEQTNECESPKKCCDISDEIENNKPEENLIVCIKEEPEISEEDSKIDISLININNEKENNKIPLKFSPNKKVFGENVDIDVETFKNHYLHEVSREQVDFSTKSTFHESINLNKSILHEQSNSFVHPPVASKIKKKKHKKKYNREKIFKKISEKKFKRNYETSTDKKYVLKFPADAGNKRKTLKRKRETEFSIRDKNIHVNIKWRKEQLKLRITKPKRNKQKVLKQYLLDNSRNSITMAPGEVSPIKRKYIKREICTDNLKQTSIENFFKVKTPEKL